MMNRTIALLPVLLFLGLVLAMQWLQSERILADLEIRLHHLDEDLYQIDISRKHPAAVEADREENANKVKMLLRQLPAEPGVDVFTEQLVSAFREHNVELDIDFSPPVDRDFYQEIAMDVHYGDAKLTELDLPSIFAKFDRLIRWHLDIPNQVLKLTIYRSLLAMDVPEVKSCHVAATATMNYWPFARGIETVVSEYNEKCVRRNLGKAMLQDINLDERNRRLSASLSRILAWLSGEPGEP